MTNTIYIGDILDILPLLEENSIQCIVTSPPYYAMRDYKLNPTDWPEIRYTLFGFEIVIPEMSCCLGLEPDHYAFVGHLIHIFRLARRVLKSDGTCWVNLGDSYASNGNSVVEQTAELAWNDLLKKHGL